MRIIGLLTFIALALAGCALPGAAPTIDAVEKDSGQDTNFVVVKVNDQILPYLERVQKSGFVKSLRRASYRPSAALHSGDVIVIAIFEAAGSGLFSSPVGPNGATSNNVTLPPQVIDRSGAVVVPFAGRIAAAGKTPAQLSQEIAEKLSKEANQPQVVVSVQTNGSAIASVNGEVNRAGPVTLSLRGERLLDAIAMAGGARFPAYETDVRVIRGHTASTVSLQEVIDDPTQNIVVRPNDQIVLVHNPRSYVVMGASQKVAQYSFDAPKVTLAEAVARSGGAVDAYGNPAGTYLFRLEPPSVTDAVIRASFGTNDPAKPPSHRASLDGRTDRAQVLYKVDMNTADGYFLAQHIQMQDKDIVLVANAEGAQLAKAFVLVRGVTGVVYDLTAKTTP